MLSIGFSDERAQVVDFTDPYAPYYIAVMGAEEVAVKDAADLAAARPLPSTAARSKIPRCTKVAPAGADIQRYSDYNGVISAFLSGQAQLMVVGNDVGATDPRQGSGDQAGGEVPAPDLALEHGGEKG